MKTTFLALVALFLVTSCTAQESPYNAKNGVVIKGYDPVSYFEGEPGKGSRKYEFTHDGVTWRFASREHLESFKKDPSRYIPQYGGYCAYAIGKNGEKVDVDPKTFEIRDGKLYLFYNSWGTNTLELWEEEGAEALKEKADKNWERMN